MMEKSRLINFHGSCGLLSVFSCQALNATQTLLCSRVQCLHVRKQLGLNCAVQSATLDFTGGVMPLRCTSEYLCGDGLK